MLAGLVALILLALATLAAFPWGSLDRTIESRLSKALGRPVTIGSIEREDRFSLHPVLDIRDITIPQPDWAEADTPMLRVHRMRFGFDALALLFGTTRIETLDIGGADALLIRTADNRINWSGASGKSEEEGSSTNALHALSLQNVTIAYRDALQNRRFDVTLNGGSQSGLDVKGSGSVHGAPVSVRAHGGAFAAEDGSGRWPFELNIEGQAVGLVMHGTMAKPLATDSIDATASAHGAGLAYVDALIEAGLPDTQPVRMTATLARRGPEWKIEKLNGTVGRSDFSGDATIRKGGGQSRIDGTLHADRFDFADLSTDAQRAKADAKQARQGKLVVPDTAIDLDNLGDVAGVLRLHADRLLAPGSDPFTSLDATLTLEKKTLTVSPLRFGMPHGTLSGKAVIAQKSAGPQLHLQLELNGGQLSDLFPASGVDAPARGRIDLTGTGKTIRAAIGAASGRLALTARNGVLPDKTALLLGQDVGGGLFAGKKKQAVLRCLIAPFTLKNGTASAGNVRIDTSRAVTRAAGTIRFPSESLNLALHGVAKQHSTLRIGGAVPVRGTIKSPKISPPEKGDSVGDVIGQVGKALFGGDEPVATDIDCDHAITAAMNF
nr:AsmA family protein [Stakelama flava]